MMKMLFGILLAFVSISSAAKTNIAVSDLMAQGLNQSDVLIITERIRSELVSTNAFNVLERSQVQNILAEQGFQQTGCTDNSCAVEIGKLLGVDAIAVGSVGKIGNMYTIALRLVDVGTGQVLFTASQDCQCSIEEVLTNSTKQLAENLAEKIEQAVYGKLEISTTPTGADIRLNGKKIGISNLTNNRILPGPYPIEISMIDRTPIFDTIQISQNILTKREFTLVFLQSYMDSINMVKKKIKAHKLFVRQLVLGALSIGTASAGYYYNSKVINSNEEYRQAGNDYVNAPLNSNHALLYSEYTAKGKIVDNNILYRNILYGLAGALGISFCVSFAF